VRAWPSWLLGVGLIVGLALLVVFTAWFTTRCAADAEWWCFLG